MWFNLTEFGRIFDMMPLGTILIIVTGIASIVLGFIVFLNGRDKSSNKYLALCNFAVGIWCIGQAMGGLNTDKGLVLFWTRVNLGGAIFIPVFYLSFIYSFTGEIKAKRKIVITFFAIAFLFLLSDFTRFFIADVGPRFDYPFYLLPGPFYYLFPVYLIFAISLAFSNLKEFVKRSSGNRRNQTKYLFWASVLGFGGGITAFFPAFNIPLPSLAHYFVPLYVAITVYAILKHNLLDIRILVRTGLTYSVMTLLFSGFYILLLIMFSKFFQEITGWNSIYVTAVLVFVFISLFEPIRRIVQNALDRLFFHQKYEYARTIKDLSDAAVSIFNKEELLNKVTETIKSTMKVSSVEISSKDEEISGFDLSLPMKANGRIVGRLNLGHKMSGEMFSKEDIDLLSTLANQVAISIENSNLYQQILRSDKLAALGTMSAGLAHEIKNPLASLKGLTQILPDNLSDDEFLKKYMEIVPRQIDRINSIVEKLMNFSKPVEGIMETVNLRNVLEGIVKLVETDCMKKGIRLIAELKDVYVYGNAEQLTQAYMNLVLNSMDAMTDGGELKIEMVIKEDRVFVFIKDKGCGILDKNIGKLFDPFFTTKENGTGLGLAIFYRIINEHNGSVEVQSKINEGTTFKTWLYTKPKE